MSFETPVQENPMTEIALALAMGFFSLMVLTLISMGTGQSSEKKLEPLSFAMASATTTQKIPADNSAGQAKQILIIFDGKQFLDAKLRPLNLEELNTNYANRAGRLVLAMDPNLSIKEAMEARRLITVNNLVVSNLNEDWLDALRSRQ
jgi:hypothetical protein